ncbi:MAG: hypothetical protein H6858_07010 [Rhodospirillales bacterium]|nr:hypothetical protein [Rhodospirillales bacterium]
MNLYDKPRLVIFLLLFLLICADPAYAGGKQAVNYTKTYSIEESYAFFNHERTPFDTKISKLSPYDVAYLKHYFSLTDQAFQLRTNMMQYFYVNSQSYKKQIRNYVDKINEVLDNFILVRAPTKELKDIEKLTMLAIAEQRDFFIEWSQANGREVLTLREGYKYNKRVISSHLKLQKAYTELMLLFKDEDPYNHKAFYDHLCALDFI